MQDISVKTREVVVYSYDNLGVYVGSFDYLWVIDTGLPANSTREAPPEHIPNNHVCVWKDGTWLILEDTRGLIKYNINTKEGIVIDDLEDLGEMWTLLQPNLYDTWVDGEWKDLRSEQEKQEEYRANLPFLPKRQFALQLHSIKDENGGNAYTKFMEMLSQDEIAQIEYDTVASISRLSPLVLTLAQSLGWSDEYVDTQWEEALVL